MKIRQKLKDYIYALRLEAMADCDAAHSVGNVIMAESIKSKARTKRDICEQLEELLMARKRK